MAGVRQWRGDELVAKLDSEMRRRLFRAAITVSRYAKKLISVAGTGIGKSGRRRYGVNPSAPGEPPHKQFGRLRASVTHEVSGSTARVGTNVVYGRFLELGTTKMAARPWLRVSLAHKLDEVRAILSAPWNPES
jgi:phage gpG-like protein